MLKKAIILPTGQWYAPSAVINDAWYCMVLHCIAWYCMVLHGIALYCMVLHGIALYCMVLHGIAWFCMVLHGIAWYCTILHYLALPTEDRSSVFCHLLPSSKFRRWIQNVRCDHRSSPCSTPTLERCTSYCPPSTGSR